MADKHASRATGQPPRKRPARAACAAPRWPRTPRACIRPRCPQHWPSVTTWLSFAAFALWTPLV
jgi:hypothetical protein